MRLYGIEELDRRIRAAIGDCEARRRFRACIERPAVDPERRQCARRPVFNGTPSNTLISVTVPLWFSQFGCVPPRSLNRLPIAVEPPTSMVPPLHVSGRAGVERRVRRASRQLAWLTVTNADVPPSWELQSTEPLRMLRVDVFAASQQILSAFVPIRSSERVAGVVDDSLAFQR
jgi:hypothetical protein